MGRSIRLDGKTHTGGRSRQGDMERGRGATLRASALYINPQDVLQKTSKLVISSPKPPGRSLPASIRPSIDSYPVLFRTLPLGFQNEIIVVLQQDQEVRPILPHDPAIQVEHLEAQMIVLDPGPTL